MLRLAAGFFFCLSFFTGLAPAAGFFKTSPSQDFLIRALLLGRGLPSASWLKLVLALLGVSGSSSSLVRILLSGLLAGAGVPFFGGFVTGLGIGVPVVGRGVPELAHRGQHLWKKQRPEFLEILDLELGRLAASLLEPGVVAQAASMSHEDEQHLGRVASPRALLGQGPGGRGPGSHC